MITHLVRNRFALTLGLMLLFSTAAMGCAQTASSPASNPGASAPAASTSAGEKAAAPAARNPQEVKVGVLFPLTGVAASTGLDCKDGAELAAEIVNNKYDLNIPFAKTEGLPNLGNAKLKLVFADHQGVPEKGQSEAERLVTQEKVVALEGAYLSTVTQTASQAAERLGIPMINGDSSSIGLTDRGLKYFFRTGAHDGTFVKNFFDLMDDIQKEKKVPVKTIAVVYENTLQGADMTKNAKKFADERGYKVVEEIPFPAGSSEVTSEVQRLKAADPDVVIMQTQTPDAILFMKTYKQLDYSPRAILAYGAGFLDPKFFEVLGKDAEYAISKAAWAPDIAEKNPVAKAIADMFQSKYNQGMTENSARNFTAIMTLADAINRAKSTDPKAIQAALAATDIPGDQLIVPWKGIKFGPDGQNVYAAGVNTQVFGGKHYTVWPFNVASKQIVWPRPKWSELK